MNKKEIGEILHRFFLKRSASFLANIYKASVTADPRDIHRARLDVKKILALFSLFDMLDPKAFRELQGTSLFRPLYRQAGKIREAHVNLLQLSAAPEGEHALPLFREWLVAGEKRASAGFVSLVKKFRERDLEKESRQIGRICRSHSIFTFRKKTREYLSEKAEAVRELLDHEPGVKELHRVRQHLKSMSTVAELVYSLKPLRELDRVITALNRTEMLIGDWHDRVVLLEAVGKFRKAEPAVGTEEDQALQRLAARLQNECSNLEEHFVPEVRKIVELATGWDAAAADWNSVNFA